MPLYLFERSAIGGKVNLFDFFDQDALTYVLSHCPAWTASECNEKQETPLLGHFGSMAQSYEIEAGISLELTPVEMGTVVPELPACSELAQTYSELIANTAAQLPPEDRALAYAYRWHLAANLPSTTTLEEALRLDDYLPLVLLFCIQQLEPDQISVDIRTAIAIRAAELIAQRQASE